MPVSFRGRPRFITAAVFLALAACIALATRIPGGRMDHFERGHWLGIASDMLAGKVPYRDTFPVHGFLSDGGLDYLLFRAFGPSYTLSLAAHFFLGVLFHPSLFLVAAAATRRPWLAAAAIPLNLALATELLAERPVVPLFALAAFLWALGQPGRRSRAVVAGCLAGLGLIYTLEFGTFVLVAELATVAVARRVAGGRPFASRSYVVGLGAVLLPFGVWLALAGGLVPFLRVSFVDLPMRIHSIWGWPFPAPWTLLAAAARAEPYRVGALTVGFGVAKRLYLCPILATLGFGLVVGIRRRAGDPVLVLRLFAVSLACLCFFRYVVARLHLEVGNALTGPLLLLVLVASYEAFGGLLPSGERRVFAGSLVLAAALVAFAMNGTARTLRLARDAVRYPARMANKDGLVALSGVRGGGALVPIDEARELAALDAWISGAVPADAGIVELTNRPALYFFLERRNASRFYQVPLMGPFQAEVIRQLESTPPAAVLLREASAPDTSDGIPNPAWIPEVWQYVDAHFPRRVRVGDTRIALPTQ